jgi:glucose/arabinose dehydrogenase
LLFAACGFVAVVSPGSGVVAGVELRTLATGLDGPVALAQAGDDRVFIVEQRGRIRVYDAGTVAPDPFLDLRDRVTYDGEQGLLGLAFHPRYSENGWLFVNYTRAGDGATVISRFTRSASDPNRGDPASEAILLTVPQPFANHNGGDLVFGPDGRLYVGLGDGGAGGDPDCRSQNRDQLLGKLLRLDVDTHADSPPFHAAPPDNPFAGSIPGADLVWALGLRNPWRFSFDRRLGDLFVADVGQSAQDEVDELFFDPAGGANFGWRVMEGNACYSRDGCPGYTPHCGDPGLVAPILVDDLAGQNCAVIGGYVYRGHRLPALEGKYLFGDYCAGKLWVATKSGDAWSRDELPFSLPTLTTFGETRVGEILLATQEGGLYTLDRPVTTACVPSPTRVCLRDGRFEVEVSVRDFAYLPYPGTAVTTSADSALFWFFSPDNWEQLVKVLDGCDLTQHYWVFGAAATDVESVVRVTDTLRGVVREYANSLGVRSPALTDTAAFATCP